MNERQININVAEARRQARELRSQADKIRNARTAYEDALRALEGVWGGRDARRYVMSAERQIQSMSRTALRLDDLAEAIDKTATLYQFDKLKSIRTRHAG